MAFAQRAGFNCCVSDDFPHAGLEWYHTRRQSLSSTLFWRSSPKSMISDFSRHSRASSISSVPKVSSAMSCLAPPLAKLARLATTRDTCMPPPNVDVMEEDDREKKGGNAQLIVVSEDEEITGLSPPDFSISQRKLYAPDRRTKQHQLQHQPQQPKSAQLPRNAANVTIIHAVIVATTFTTRYISSSKVKWKTATYKYSMSAPRSTPDIEKRPPT
jgi:hypothetical protein